LGAANRAFGRKGENRKTIVRELYQQNIHLPFFPSYIDFASSVFITVAYTL
jgi:hypothetical protein